MVAEARLSDPNYVEVTINQDLAAMNEPRVREFIHEVLTKIETFPSELRPLLLSTITISVVLSNTTDATLAYNELSDHILRSLPEAMQKREAAIKLWRKERKPL